MVNKASHQDIHIHRHRHLSNPLQLKLQTLELQTMTTTSMGRIWDQIDQKVKVHPKNSESLFPYLRFVRLNVRLI